MLMNHRTRSRVDFFTSSERSIKDQPFLNAALAAPLAARDYASVDEMLRESVALNSFTYMVLYDAQARFVAAAGWDAALEGRPPKDAPLPARANCRFPVPYEMPIMLAGQKLGGLCYAICSDSIEDAFTALLTKNALVGVGCLSLLAMVLALTHRTLTRPLVLLTAASHAVRAGRHDVSVPVTGRDEIADLGASFNIMAAEVHRRIAALTESEANQRRLLEESKQHARELRIAEERARQAELRLFNAIDALAEGFRLWDADDRLILSNRAFKAQSAEPRSTANGTTFEQDLRAAVALGEIQEAAGCEEEYVRQRLAQHRRADGSPIEFRHADGRWFEVREHRTDEGGVVQIRLDVTHQKRYETELRSARDAAERASRAKSEFLSKMSHDLRTPLNAVLGFAQILLLEEGGERLSEQQRSAVGTIERTGRHLLELVEDILDLSRIENRAIQLSIEMLALDQVVAEAQSHTAAMAADHRTRLVLLTDFGLQPRVIGDRRRVVQVMTNLLSNAIKYGIAGGEVAIDAAPVDDHIRVSVSDNGPGIAPEHQMRLFEPFNRAGAEHSATEGTGIGLTIAKGLVEQMGGAIGCESKPGQGARFWFTLPRATAHPAEREISTPQPSKEHSSLRDIGTVTILYIEDTPDNLALVRRILGRYPNVRYLEAEAAELGIEIALRERPDVILMDMRMPGMSGLDALRVLRSDPRTRDLPVIALTGAAMPHEASTIRKAGFDGYVTKPFRISTLLSQLVGALEKRVERVGH